MIKLLALDMDGTLLNEAKEIPQAHIDAIHKAIDKGVKLVLCTGRPLFGVPSISRASSLIIVVPFYVFCLYYSIFWLK